MRGAFERAAQALYALSPRVLFAGGAALYLALGQYHVTWLQAAGDEPHYLIMAQSLWREHDLDLQDNYARQDFLEYTPGPLATHYGEPRKDGRPFPSHSPGLPVVLAPLYALGGRRACVGFMTLLAAATAILVRSLATRITPSPRAVFFAWAAAAGPPLLYYSFHMYTEIPSAFL